MQICVCSLKYIIIPAKLSIHLLIISHINFNFLPPLLQDYRPGREASGDAVRPPAAAGRRGRVQHRRLPPGQEDLRAVVPPPIGEVIPRGVRAAKGEVFFWNLKLLLFFLPFKCKFSIARKNPYELHYVASFSLPTFFPTVFRKRNLISKMFLDCPMCEASVRAFFLIARTMF